MKAIILDGTPKEIGEALKEAGIGANVAISTPMLEAEEAAPAEPVDGEGWVPMPTEVGRRLLSRRQLAAKPTQAIIAIYEAGDEGVLGNELCELLDYEPAQFRGMMGAFGRRMFHTEGFKEGMYFFDQEWVDNVGYRYKLPPTSRLAVEAELLKTTKGAR